MPASTNVADICEPVKKQLVIERLNAYPRASIHDIRRDQLTCDVLRKQAIAPLAHTREQLLELLQQASTTWIIVDFDVDDKYLKHVHQQEGPHTTVFCMGAST